MKWAEKLSKPKFSPPTEKKNHLSSSKRNRKSNSSQLSSMPGECPSLPIPCHHCHPLPVPPTRTPVLLPQCQSRTLLPTICRQNNGPRNTVETIRHMCVCVCVCESFSVVVNFKKQFCQFCICREYFVVGLFFTVKWHFFFSFWLLGEGVLFCIVSLERIGESHSFC